MSSAGGSGASPGTLSTPPPARASPRMETSSPWSAPRKFFASSPASSPPRSPGILKVPAVVASFQEDGTAVGSIRAVRGFPTSSYLEACADLFIDYGGHDAAAGFSLQMKDWPEFEARTIAYCRALELEDGEESIEIDAELPHDYLKPDIAAVSERFEPFGEANEPLVFLARDVPIADAQLVGKKEQNHLKLDARFR